MVKRKNNKRKMSGFADTKYIPHKQHPAHYKKLSNDDIVYLTFTHHPIVKINGKLYKTIPLNSNINPSERPNISYAYPQKFAGKRSALGKENNKYKLVDSDKEKVEYLFKILPIYKTTKTKNKKQ